MDPVAVQPLRVTVVLLEVTPKTKRYKATTFVEASIKTDSISVGRTIEVEESRATRLLMKRVTEKPPNEIFVEDKDTTLSNADEESWMKAKSIRTNIKDPDMTTVIVGDENCHSS